MVGAVAQDGVDRHARHLGIGRTLHQATAAVPRDGNEPIAAVLAAASQHHADHVGAMRTCSADEQGIGSRSDIGGSPLGFHPKAAGRPDDKAVSGCGHVNATVRDVVAFLCVRDLKGSVLLERLNGLPAGLLIGAQRNGDCGRKVGRKLAQDPLDGFLATG